MSNYVIIAHLPLFLSYSECFDTQEVMHSSNIYEIKNLKLDIERNS